MEVGGRNNSYPGGKLSNFTGFQFVFDGVHCNSMEGLLQAFKYEKIDSQIATCQLVGFNAKKKGVRKKFLLARKTNSLVEWSSVSKKI